MLTTTTLENFLEIIKTIYVADIIDMAIIAYLAYKLIQLVNETRAGQLVKGAIVILLIYALVDLLELRAMHEIMRYVLQYGIMMLIVIFQPELRKMLEQVGRVRFASRFSNLGASFASAADMRNARTTELINSICDSCAALSRDRIGALMVVERGSVLKEIIDTGTVIDSAPTPELIQNIFFPNSPLHDGALVIRDNRLYAAGCFLPLSDNYSISRNLGTRHRAALGMSEQSDAIVVVVSEETGAISVAYKSKLNYHISVAELYTVLKEHLIDKDDASNPLSDVRSLFKRIKKDE